MHLPLTSEGRKVSSDISVRSRARISLGGIREKAWLAVDSPVADVLVQTGK